MSSAYQRTQMTPCRGRGLAGIHPLQKLELTVPPSAPPTADAIIASKSDTGLMLPTFCAAVLAAGCFNGGRLAG